MNKRWQIVLSVLILAIGFFVIKIWSDSQEIDQLKTTIEEIADLRLCQKALIEKDQALKIWQDTAYRMMDYNRGEINADSMVIFLQTRFKIGASIVDWWLRSTGNGNMNISDPLKKLSGEK